MATRKLTIQLTGSERPDGSTYFYSETLPGFHFILARGEDRETVLTPALLSFLGLFLKGLSKNLSPAHLHLEPTEKRSDQRREFTAELEYA